MTLSLSPATLFTRTKADQLSPLSPFSSPFASFSPPSSPFTRNDKLLCDVFLQVLPQCSPAFDLWAHSECETERSYRNWFKTQKEVLVEEYAKVTMLGLANLNGLHEDIGECLNVTELVLRNVHLKTLPESFNHLTLLEKIYCVDSTIPRGLLSAGVVVISSSDSSYKCPKNVKLKLKELDKIIAKLDGVRDFAVRNLLAAFDETDAN